MSQSKSLLAKLLATENISIQRDASAETASFDIKSRVLILPVWQNISEDLEDMLVVHEVGHALDTPAKGWMDGMKRIAKNICGNTDDSTLSAVKGFLNVIEDARIDKRQKRRYPGSRRNYLIGYKELIDRDFFGTSNREVNSFSFIDRVNMYFKGGFNAGIKFSSEEMPFVKRIENAETFAEVVDITEAVFEYAKKKGEDQQDTNYGTLKIGKSSEDDDLDENGSSSDEDFDGEDFDDEDFDADDTSSSMRGEGDIEAEDQDKKPNGFQSGSSNNGEYVPQSETDKAWQRKMSEILASDKIKFNYVTVPKPNMKNILSDYKSFIADNMYSYMNEMWRLDNPREFLDAAHKEMVAFRNEDNATISFMVKEFEMKKSADIFSRISIAKTGVIDTNKIYSYKYNEDIFRRQSIIPEGKNHGFIMVLDWSGSMSGNIRETVKQLISLTSFCKRTQIPFEVYIFRDPNAKEINSRGPSFNTKVGDMKLATFTMRNILSSRMKPAELIEAYKILWALSRSSTKNDVMGGTPLNQAIVATEEIVKTFRATSKAQIVNVIFLTDGESNSIGGVEGLRLTKYEDWSNKVVNKYIIQDKETGKEYYFNEDVMPDKEVTINLLKRLKDRTGVNLIGFYLYDYSSYNRVETAFFGYNVDRKFSETMRKSWSDNKFIPVSSQGYDDYYIINTPSMKNTENNLTVDSNMSKTKIAKEFMKFSNKKSVNRILLKRFIDKVA